MLKVSFDIHNSLEEGRGAIELLAQSLNDQLASNDDYLIFLVKQCLNQKVNPEVLNALMNKLITIKNPKQNKDLLLTLVDLQSH